MIPHSPLMEYTFAFVGGPLDGARLHGDDGKPVQDGMDFGPVVYADTEGGLIGRQFGVINPFTPANLDGTIQLFRRHVYEVADRRIVMCISSGRKFWKRVFGCKHVSSSP